METSFYIARIMGPFMIILSLGLVVNLSGFRLIIDEFLKNPALIFLAGIISLLIGLFIINSHNLWVADWRVIITLFGWLAFIGGIVRTLAPRQAAMIGAKMLAESNSIRIIGAIILIIGLFLFYMGYFA